MDRDNSNILEDILESTPEQCILDTTDYQTVET